MELKEIERRTQALERAIAEVERRSRVCVEAARFGWGGTWDQERDPPAV